jgi:hypothetical protein
MQIGKGGFRLDHPELGQVAAGVGVLGTKCRAEGVNFGQRQAVSFNIELTGNGQESLAAEEIPTKIDLSPSGVRGGLSQIERTDPKQRTGTLAIAGGDDRCMYPKITPFSCKKRWIAWARQ